MNFRTTLILLGVMVAVGLVVFFVSRTPDKPELSPEERTVLKMAAADVVRVTVASADDKFVLVKSGEDWRLTAPINAPVEGFSATGLVNALTALKSRGEVDITPTTGLEKPRYTVELADKNGKSVTLRVGRASAIGGNLYVATADSKGLVVPASGVLEQLEKPWGSYRKTQLISTAFDQIRQVEISYDDQKISLAKSGDQWEITSPEKLSAESGEVSSIISAITGLTAANFVDESKLGSDKATQALLPKSNAQLTVWFSAAAPTTQPATRPAGTTVRFGGYDDIRKQNVYVDVSEGPVLARVSASSMDAFKKTVLDLRNRDVVKIDAGEVSTISILEQNPATTRPSQPLVLARQKNTRELGPMPPATQPATGPSTQPATQPSLPPTDWVIRSSGNKEASQAMVNDVLAQFNPLRAQKFVAPPAPATQPTAGYVVEITTEKGGVTKKHEIRITKADTTSPLLARYEKLAFELDAQFAQRWSEDFSNKAEAPAPPPFAPPGGFRPDGLQGIPGLP